MRGIRLILTRFDPGWLFVIAGVALCSAGILIPAQDDLDALRGQLDRLEERKATSAARIAAYEQFLRELERREPRLVRRLAASQLNMLPANVKPVLLSSSRHSTVMDWIHAGVAVAPVSHAAPPKTALSRLTGGPHRLWVLAAGITVIFVGLLLEPGAARAAGMRRLVIPRWPRVDRGESGSN